MSKRGNGEGGISRHKSSGLYMARYTVKTETGTKRKTVYGKTRREAAEKLTEALARRDKGLLLDAGALTVGTYLDRWLDDSVRDTVRQRTWERYEQLVRVHLKPVLGRIKLKNLNPSQVRSLYREKIDAGSSPRTVNYIHVTLHKALKDATSDGLVPKNVAAAVKSSRPEKPEIHPLTREQARVLLDLASRDGNRFEALYVVAIHCGLREGELLGLRWADVDLELGTLQVRRTLSGTRKRSEEQQGLTVEG